MVIFDVVPRDFKVVKQSPIQGNTGGWQLNFLLPSNAAPMAALMGNQQSYPRNHLNALKVALFQIATLGIVWICCSIGTQSYSSDPSGI
jgi:amino acid transporter